MKVLIVGQGVSRDVIEEIITMLNKMPELVISENNRQYDFNKMYEVREYYVKRYSSMSKLWKGCEVVENKRRVQISKPSFESTKYWSSYPSYIKQRRCCSRNHY